MGARVTIAPVSVNVVWTPPSVPLSRDINLPPFSPDVGRARISRESVTAAGVTFSTSSASASEASADCGRVLDIAGTAGGSGRARTPSITWPPPLLLIHGFGASIPHWRRNIAALSEKYTVYAIDLLGFGASDKPAGFSYTMEAWAELILDFLDEIVQLPAVLLGNSVGSLACLIAASGSSRRTSNMVSGLVLLNCAGGMNNKAVVDDWRIKLLLPLLWFLDFLLKQRPIASALLECVKQSDNLKNILLSVYANKENVDDELVEIISGPANDEGALDAFISTVTDPPGPNPVQLMSSISQHVLVLWGDQDPFTPLDGHVGKYFSALPSNTPNVSLSVLQGAGHCPHDDIPDLVHQKLLPWLDRLTTDLLQPQDAAS